MFLFVKCNILILTHKMTNKVQIKIHIIEIEKTRLACCSFNNRN